MMNKPLDLALNLQQVQCLGKTSTSTSKSVFRLSVRMCNVTLAIAEGIVDAAEIFIQLTKSQRWCGPSNVAHHGPAFPPQCDCWGMVWHPKGIPSHSAPAATWTDQRSNLHLENSITQTHAHRHKHTLQASVNYEILNPLQNCGDFINHKNDEIIAT